MLALRSQSFGNSRTQEYNTTQNENISHINTSGLQDLRCHSASYVTISSSSSSSLYSSMQTDGNGRHVDVVESGGGELKRGKSTTNRIVSKSWSFNDPELKRKKRVASYKAYTVEGKVKGSIKNTFRWIKDKCSKVIRGGNM